MQGLGCVKHNASNRRYRIKGRYTGAVIWRLGLGGRCVHRNERMPKSTGRIPTAAVCLMLTHCCCCLLLLLVCSVLFFFPSLLLLSFVRSLSYYHAGHCSFCLLLSVVVVLSSSCRCLSFCLSSSTRRPRRRTRTPPRRIGRCCRSSLRGRSCSRASDGQTCHSDSKKMRRRGDAGRSAPSARAHGTVRSDAVFRPSADRLRLAACCCCCSCSRRPPCVRR